jgi:uncharacterized phage infection (PIP) family protein YhgE
MEQTIKSKFKRELDAITTIRDELRLKAHLARKDLKDEIAELESKLSRADDEISRVKAHAQNDVEQIGASFKDLLTELKQGFESVKRRLS